MGKTTQMYYQWKSNPTKHG